MIAKFRLTSQALALVLCACLSTVAFAADTLDAARAQARKEKKPLLIDFYAEWCGPCKVFTRDSKKNADIKQKLKSVVLLKVDAEKGNGAHLAEQYGVSGYPTFVLVNADQEVIYRWTGYSKDHFIGQIDTALEDPRPISQKIASYKKKKTLNTAAFLANYHVSKGEYGQAIKLYEEAESLRGAKDPSYQSDIWEVKFEMFRREEEGIEFADLHRSAQRALAQADHETGMDIAKSMIYLSKKEKNREQLVGYIGKAMEVAKAMSPEQAKKVPMISLKADHQLYIEGKPEKALATIKTGYDAGWDETPDGLNRFAWWCFENEVNLEEASRLAAKGAALAEPGSDRANILDTQAEIENARGNVAKAVALMEEAVRNYPDRAFFKRQLERFKKALTESEASIKKS